MSAPPLLRVGAPSYENPVSAPVLIKPSFVTVVMIIVVGIDNFVRYLRQSKQNELADYVEMPEETRKQFTSKL